MKTLITISSVLLLFLTTSCMFNGVKGNRNVITQQRSISSDFTAIEVSNGINVHLTMSKETSLSVEADENLHDIIKTEVEDGVLHIYTEKNIWRAKARKVYLSTSTINRIKATSGLGVFSENTITADDFDVNTSSGANVKLMLNVANLDCDTSSGANASLKGVSAHFVANSSSGSNLKARDLTSKTCNADVSSGANISVNVSEQLDANASSGGNIQFSGSPKVVNKNSSSGGSISG